MSVRQRDTCAARYGRAWAVQVTLAFAPEPRIEIWHSDPQPVGHLGDAQNDFNVLGHVEPERELGTLRRAVNDSRYWTPLSFHAFRRLATAGEFNADVYNIWRASESEPDAWDWQHVQTSRDALRVDGLALLARLRHWPSPRRVFGARRLRRKTNAAT